MYGFPVRAPVCTVEMFDGRNTGVRYESNRGRSFYGDDRVPDTLRTAKNAFSGSECSRGHAAAAGNVQQAVPPTEWPLSRELRHVVDAQDQIARAAHRADQQRYQDLVAAQRPINECLQVLESDRNVTFWLAVPVACVALVALAILLLRPDLPYVGMCFQALATIDLVLFATYAYECRAIRLARPLRQTIVAPQVERAPIAGSDGVLREYRNELLRLVQTYK